MSLSDSKRTAIQVSLGLTDAEAADLSLADLERLYWSSEYSAPVYCAFKTTNTTRNNTTTRTDDPELTMDVDPGTYIIDAYIPYIGTTTGDLNLEMTVPASSTLSWSAEGLSVGATATSGSSAPRTAVFKTTGGSIVGAINSDVAATISGSVVVIEAGTVAIAWAQNTADASDLTVYAGAWLRLTRVNEP